VKVKKKAAPNHTKEEKTANQHILQNTVPLPTHQTQSHTHKRKNKAKTR